MSFAFCPFCGSRLVEGARFCSACGAALEQPTNAPQGAAATSTPATTLPAPVTAPAATIPSTPPVAAIPSPALASVAPPLPAANVAPAISSNSPEGGRPMRDVGRIWIGMGKERVFLHPKMLNRHGLIAGATGTGKTTSTKVMAEAFSDLGIPVFMTDIKGDVSGMCQQGVPVGYNDARVVEMQINDFRYEAYPVRFFDVFGEKGIPVRAMISDMGPLLLARILGLNETQTGILQIVFKVADDSGLLLLDLKDLRSMVKYVGDNAKELTTNYGNITPQSIGAIQRGLLTLETSGGDRFFGEPALDLQDWLVVDSNGRGFINIMDCVALFQSPLLYTTFLLWMLSALYEIMPEVGDLDLPKLVFFFDEAHLLFNGAPKALLQKIEQVVRLIRSKGVGIYFITQSPSDIPDTVLSQLGNKIQHALRAYTPKDQKAVRAAAQSYRPNPEFNSEAVLSELAIGEALFSVLDAKGAPEVVQRAFLMPLKSFAGPAEPALIARLIQTCPLYGKYKQAIDRDSAYEVLQRKQEQDELIKRQQEQLAAQLKASKQPARKTTTPLDRAVSSAMGQVGRDVGRSLTRGIFGNLLK